MQKPLAPNKEPLAHNKEPLAHNKEPLAPNTQMPSEKKKPIVIFDSGVGGLSVYQEVKQKLPELSVVYCSDNEGFPYGPKPESEVIDRTLHCLHRLVKQYDPEMVIIACNTASTISLPRAREELNIPVVGVVPAIKPASIASKKRCIGLLATPGTIQREYTDQLIKEFAGDCEVIRVGSSELVHLAEQYLRGEAIDHNSLRAVIDPFFGDNNWPDCIVLGCTHFPLLKDALEALVPEPVLWVDSGEAIARRVESLLNGKAAGFNTADDLFLHTGSSETIINLKPALESMGFSAQQALQ